MSGKTAVSAGSALKTQFKVDGVGDAVKQWTKQTWELAKTPKGNGGYLNLDAFADMIKGKQKAKVGGGSKHSNQIPLNLQFFGGEGGGNKPPNLSPKGAGRNGAFREAKRKMGIPVNEQPQGIYQNFDKRGKKSPGTQYDFGDGKVIRDDSNGHVFPDDPNQSRGPHFNDPSGNHYDY